MVLEDVGKAAWRRWLISYQHRICYCLGATSLCAEITAGGDWGIVYSARD